jgi:hypothetical protein
MRAQRWINATDVWEFPFQPLQAFTPGTPNSILLPDYTGFANSTWWTITGNSSPLPVTLLDFYAKTLESKVRLHWTTASEIDNSHFDVERTLDNSSFEFIGRVKSQGTSNNLQEYDLWDNYPLMGTQYYYLRQYDYDGKLTSYGPVSATFSKDQFDIITTTVSPSENGLSVVFNYNSKQPYSYRIMDMTGRIIIAKDKNPAVEGINVIDINVSLAKGAYYIVLQNNEKVVSRKFFY